MKVSILVPVSLGTRVAVLAVQQRGTKSYGFYTNLDGSRTPKAGHIKASRMSTLGEFHLLGLVPGGASSDAHAALQNKGF